LITKKKKHGEFRKGTYASALTSLVSYGRSSSNEISGRLSLRRTGIVPICRRILYGNINRKNKGSGIPKQVTNKSQNWLHDEPTE
jgi:hypothetical protein